MLEIIKTEVKGKEGEVFGVSVRNYFSNGIGIAYVWNKLNSNVELNFFVHKEGYFMFFDDERSFVLPNHLEVFKYLSAFMEGEES